MYKTAIITDEISQSLPEAVTLMRQYRLDAMEIRSVNERNPFQMTKEDIREIKRISDAEALPVCCVASPLFKCFIDDLPTYRAHVESFRRMLDTMALWNVSLIRGFPFLNVHDQGARMPEAAERFQPVIRAAEDAGVTIVIESEPSVYTANIRDLVAFLKRLDTPVVRALFDAGNEIVDPDAPPPYPDGYRLIKPYLRHVHVKDILRAPGAFVPAMLGEGSVDYRGIVDALKRDYDGYVSVETHYRVHAGVSDEDLLHPQGSSFSAGGYEASHRYLDALSNVYRWQEPPRA